MTEEHQPFSLEAQESKLRAYVTSQPGWSLVATFGDDGSGAALDRPGLQKALAAARARRFDVLLVYRVDRFTRRASTSPPCPSRWSPTRTNGSTGSSAWSRDRVHC